MGNNLLIEPYEWPPNKGEALATPSPLPRGGQFPHLATCLFQASGGSSLFERFDPRVIHDGMHPCIMNSYQSLFQYHFTLRITRHLQYHFILDKIGRIF